MKQSSRGFTLIQVLVVLGFIVMCAIIYSVNVKKPLFVNLFKKTNPTLVITPLGEEPLPTNSPTPTFVEPTITNRVLDNTPDKNYLGSSAKYAVYLVNSKELNIISKTNDNLTKIKGIFAISGEAIITDDGYDRYVSISTGTDPKRNAIIISLATKSQIGKDICMVGQPMFWFDQLIYNNCDHYANRPWGEGLAPSIVAMNLKTLAVKTLLKSTSTVHYGIKSVTEKELTYYQTFLSSGVDWSKNNLIKTITKTYSLGVLKK